MKNILVIGAHPDDEIYGCGATINKLVQDGYKAHALILTEGCSSQYPNNQEIAQQKKQESIKASNIIGYQSFYNAQLPDMQLDSLKHIQINKVIEEHIQNIKPTIVFTHHSGDINLDHQLCSASTLVACRPGSGVHEIIFYETPSSTEWGSGFEPNLFYNINEDILNIKLKAIESYQTELRPAPHPRSTTKIKAWAQYRGCAANCQYAEAFYIYRKWV